MMVIYLYLAYLLPYTARTLPRVGCRSAFVPAMVQHPMMLSYKQ